MVTQVASLVSQCDDPDGIAVLACLSRHMKRAERAAHRGCREWHATDPGIAGTATARGSGAAAHVLELRAHPSEGLPAGEGQDRQGARSDAPGPQWVGGADDRWLLLAGGVAEGA
ncbi:MAG TPA: hypothetical protein VGP82_07135 [Ktedonobacterales bacterium]|jgi:hypothetical protein|nr:hypothetical protein [Ktedonobacterales bacterium]